MPANSSSQPSILTPPVVVVPAADKSLQFSTPLDRDFGAFDDDDARKLKEEGLVAIWNNTTLKFKFNGTGIAVVGLTQQSFPLIPTKLLPSFNCLVDGQPSDPLDSSSKFSSHSGGTSDIPADGGQLICRKKDLQLNQNHTLIVDITVSSVPAFLDSVRFHPPMPNDSGAIKLNNTFLRIDPHDPSHIQFDNQSWGYDHWGHLSSKRDGPGGFMNITIPSSQVQTLQWFGGVYMDHVDHDHESSHSGPSLPVTLDGNPSQVQLSLNDEKVFSLPTNGSTSSQVQLSIQAPEQYQLSLDRLMVTLGKPMLQSLTDNNNTTTGSPEKKGASSPAIPIVSGIVGSLFIIFATLFIVRCVEKRRRWRDTWKDSAIQHPGTRVSSRSSFSRETVTGDIEYNPEAQKKLEGAFNAGVMEPPPALIVHADSGYRGIGAPEIPPYYTRM